MDSAVNDDSFSIKELPEPSEFDHVKVELTVPPLHNESVSEVFKIDMDAIACVPKENQENELLQLGITAYDQTKLEEQVIAQVESAFRKKEEEIKQKQAEKELKELIDELRMVKQRMGQIDKALGMAPKTALSKDAKRQVESIKREKENKMNSLKKLEAKRRSLCALLGQSFEPTSNIDLSETCELEDETKFQLSQVFSNQTDNDLLISTGEMTPFGTILPKATKKKTVLISNKIRVPNGDLTDFEKFLLQNANQNVNSLPVPVRKKIPEKFEAKINNAAIREENLNRSSTSNKIFSVASTSRDFPLLKIKKKKKKIPLGSKHATGMSPRKRPFVSMNTNYTSDLEISDVENGDTNYEENDFDKPDKSGSEYEPEYESPNDSELEDPNNRKSIKKDENDVPWISVSKKGKAELNEKKSNKRKNGSFKRVQDDGNEKVFLRRLREYRMQLIMEKEEKAKQRLLNAEDIDEEEEDDDDDEEDTVEFDGGFKVPNKIWSKLFRYQQTGVRWLWELHQQNCGGIIGDEMGLGKTIQVISFLAGLQVSNLRTDGDKFQGLGPVILVCPATVMHQWVREFHKWWPPVRVGVLHCSGSYSGSKDSLVRYVNKSKGVLVTSYAGITHYQPVLTSYEWHYVVLDEGHKIRNPDAQVTLACKQFRTPHRIILSGSPIQNNLKELWSLFDFVFPGKLGTLPIFMQQFSVPITHGGYANATEVQVQTAYKCAVVLRDTIGPYMLRRLKSDVQMSLQLPNKNEQVLFCKLAEEQREVYKQYLESSEIAQIVDEKLKIFVGLINLRNICNHPDIFTGGPKIFKHTDIDSLTAEERYGYFKRAGKMVVVEALLRLWQQQGHRVLLFTQGRKMLKILEEFMQSRSYTYMKMDGTTGIGSRQPAIHKFNTDKSIFIFLLTTRVGGLGVNLTGANRVIIYDPDWNPSTDLQARERAWRIGQEKQVTIYRLLTAGTIEEKIYHRQIFKQFLINRVLKDPRQRRFFKSNDLHELFTLGAEDGKGTETSAIFAGTGSEVKLSKLKKPLKKAPESPKFSFSPQKVEKMKEIAKKLSLKMNKVKTEEVTPSESAVLNGSNLTEDSKNANVHVKPNKKNNSERRKEKGSRKKKRKEFEGIVFEGNTTISHLVAQTTFKQAEEENEDSKQDDYILKKLLKKASVQTALRHDNIVNSSDPDYLLVEGEAERVAKEAVQALKKSRRQCLRAEAGVPTWTGNNGTSGAPPAIKKRFGLKKNTKLASPVKSSSASTENTEKPTGSVLRFGKKKPVVATETDPQPETSDSIPTSSELLEKMRQRNNMFLSKKSNDDEDRSSDDGVSHLPGKPTEYDDMLCDIRNFVAFQSEVNGEATTGEVLGAFKDKIPIHGTPVFKALLSRICIFYRSAVGTGVWKLKREFR